MTENEIIERLEALVKNGFPFCADALNLINHLKELDKKNENIIRLANKTIESQSKEIEKKDIEIDILIRKKEALKDEVSEVERLKVDYDRLESASLIFKGGVDYFKAKAIKEFEEKLKLTFDKAINGIPRNSKGFPLKSAIIHDIHLIIDEVKKEMVGDDNA